MKKRSHGKRAGATKPFPPGDAAKPSATPLDWVMAHWEKFAAALIATLAAMVAFWLEPLKDLVLHRIYSERAELALLLDAHELPPGAAVRVRVRIIPGPDIDAADGIVTLRFDPALLALGPGSLDSFNVRRSSQTRIFDEGAFVLFAKKHTTAVETRLSATYRTKYGTHSAPEVALKLLAQTEDDPMPFIERSGGKAINLGGTWRIQIGASQGSMRVRQDAHNDITGNYWFLAPQRSSALPVSGYKDGTAFKVFYWQDPQGTKRWFIDANFALNKEDPRFIEMKGCAFSIVNDVGVIRDSPAPQSDTCLKRDFVGWRGVAASTFYATAQIRE